MCIQNAHTAIKVYKDKYTDKYKKRINTDKYVVELKLNGKITTGCKI